MNDAITVSLISAISGIVIAYIVNVAAKKVQANKEKSNPKTVWNKCSMGMKD